MHDKLRFLRDYFLFSDEILTVAEAKQKRIQVLVCLRLTINQRKEIFVFVSKAPSKVGKLASSRANSLLVIPC